MGRRFPVAQIHQSNHPIIAWSFFIACIAATIAIVSPLCGVLCGRKSSPPTAAAKSETKDHDPDQDVAPPPPTDATLTAPPPAVLINPDEKDYANQPLPPPPAMLAAASSNINRSNSLAPQLQRNLTSSRSKRILSSSISMKGIGNAMSLRQLSRREDHNYDHKKKFKHQDSLLNKTIILGEKCKVPDEDDAILYDEKGNRITTYHPRTPGSGSVSRQASCNNRDAFPRFDGNKANDG